MKKSLIAVAVLATLTGVAQAASSVTLYGRVDVGYSNDTGDDISLAQTSKGEVRLGLKGNEDLGNGLSATFQLEGRFDGDTGAKSTNRTFFDRESTVGLKGSFGHVRLGRSISALEQGISFVDAGRRATGMIQTYASATRHSNALFYNYNTGAFSFGADVTTKGGYNDGLFTDKIGSVEYPNTAFSNEGVKGSKISYGLFAKYKANNLELGVAYQADRSDKNQYVSSSGTRVTTMKSEWGVAAGYTFNPVTIGASYAAGKNASNYKVRTIAGLVSFKATANDTVNVIYNQVKTDTSATAATKKTRYGLGYIHALSKRTSIYADVARNKTSKTGVASTSSTTYDVALRHSF